MRPFKAKYYLGPAQGRQPHSPLPPGAPEGSDLPEPLSMLHMAVRELLLPPHCRIWGNLFMAPGLLVLHLTN